MNGRNITFAMLIVAGISTSFALPAHGQMVEKIIDWDKEVTDAGGLQEWAGKKVDGWVGKLKENIIDVAPYSESIKDARDVYNLRSRNESKALDLVNNGIKNFDDIQFESFNQEADRVGFGYLKDGLGTAKEVIERKGNKLLEPLDEITSSAKKQLGRVEHVGKRLGEFKDAVGSRLDKVRDRFGSDENFSVKELNPLKSSGEGSGSMWNRGNAAEPGEAIYSGPLTDRVEPEGLTAQENSDADSDQVLELSDPWNNQESAEAHADEEGIYLTSHEQTNEPTPLENATAEERTMPNAESKGDWIEVVPNEDLSGTDWVEIQPEQDYDPSLRDGDGSDPLAKFINSTDTSGADRQVSNYLAELDPAITEMQTQLQGDYNRIDQEMNTRLGQIREEYAAVSRQVNEGFSRAVQEEFARATSGFNSGGMQNSNSRCQIVVAETNRNRSFLRSNPEGFARDAAGNAYNVRARNQQLQSWYNRNCR